MAILDSSEWEDEPIKMDTSDRDAHYYYRFDHGEQLTLDNWCRQ